MKLERFLFSPHINEVKCHTVDILFENYRTRRLLDIAEPDGTQHLEMNPFLVLEAEHQTENNLVNEREKSLTEKFEAKAKEKKKFLLEQNNDFELSILQQRMEIAQDTQDIQRRRKSLEEEIHIWEEKMFNLSNLAKTSKRKTISLPFSAFKKKHTRNPSNSSNL